MARCEICDKNQQTGHKISITRSQVSRRYNRKWKPNIKKLRVIDSTGTPRRMHMCTSCLRTNLKNNMVKRAN